MEQGIIGRKVMVKPQILESFLMKQGVQIDTPYTVLGIVQNMLLLEVGKNLVELYPRRLELV